MAKLPSLLMYNGLRIPVIGLGTSRSKAGEVENAIRHAMDAGYRHIDTAWVYGNEEAIGDTLQEIFKKGKVKRPDVFITSKLWNNSHEKNRVVPALEDTLDNLQLDYVDLYLMHYPMAFKRHVTNYTRDPTELDNKTDYLDTWKGMEQCLKLKYTKSIGVSNFNSVQLQRLLGNCCVRPAVNQIEVNPNFSNLKLRKFCTEQQIVVVGLSPLGRADAPKFFKDNPPKPTLLDCHVGVLAKKYKRTPAQIILNYLVSLGICVIPKTTRRARLQQNIDIFEFKLEKEDVEYMESLNKNRRVVEMEHLKSAKYYPFSEPY